MTEKGIVPSAVGRFSGVISESGISSACAGVVARREAGVKIGCSRRRAQNAKAVNVVLGRRIEDVRLACPIDVEICRLLRRLIPDESRRVRLHKSTRI